ncbi:AAA family ATPase [Cellulomonas marina]|uniref:Nuclease SbcCD subunit C n=1 Tax=Cellulomonas marina TaxID=988821 RepID=A0A1I0XZ27_9CELL|nr:AAA family ATPase [Cellulomonas marina]GIG28491.1 hypothetical protein Cma02nite_10910 [Cellulomonas marina]SFB05408.1 exonuclease SbcC [Cellulomonas marina]
MHLRTLTLQALGPFRGRHIVDLAALGASGLFLLEGPTGAGKSTLIDAVVFALYGKVASADASDERLRCTLAADDVETVVDLVFEVEAGLFRVRRTPAYDRAKKRGTGSVRQQASVRLWRLTPDDPEGTLVASRLDEAGAEILRVVGLDRAQFVQTMVLPQGEFARFLRADPEERRGLLQTIFGTEVYERLQARLVELRREADRATEEARNRVTGALARTVGAAGLDEGAATALAAALEEAGPTTGAVLALTAPLAAVAAGLAEDAAAAGEAAAVAGDVLSGVEEALHAAERTVVLVRRRTDLLGQRSALQAEEPAVQVRRGLLVASRTAGPVRGPLSAADRARTERTAAAKALEAACDAAPAALLTALGGATAGGGTGTGTGGEHAGGAGSAGVTLGVLAEREAQARAVLARLERPVALEAGLEARRRGVREARAEVDDASAVAAAVAVALAARPEGRAALEEAREALADAPAALVRAEGAVAEAEALARGVLAAAAAAEEVGAAQDAVTRCAGAAGVAVAAEAEARTRRVAGLAGELAQDLVPGTPCAVCGGREHPLPAPLAPDHVTEEDVERLTAARERAEARLSAAAARLAEVTALADAAHAAVGGATADDAREVLAAARAALEAAEADRTALLRAEADLREHDARTERLRAEAQEAAGRRAEAEAGLVVLVGALEADEAEVRAARDGHPTVAARHSAAAAEVDVLVELLEAVRAHAEADRTAARCEADLAAALLAAGHGDEAACRAALLEPEEEERLDAQVRAHEARLAAVTAALADPELAAVADLSADALPDLTLLTAARAEARSRARDAAGRAQAAADRVEALRRHADALTAAAADLDAAVAAAAPVQRLAALASGTGRDNATGLSLATYVLGRRFEDVVAAANERLAVMSDGRYALARSEEREDVRTRRTGLAMKVLDHRTGASRDPRTLSGGETFYVSLCLALGLADVVSAEAGGIRLGTLFVDEGFGSLDPGTLEGVLAELGRLRAGGRTVGVVSHVEALKQAVADRIEVRPCGDGSSTLRVLAG